MKRALERHARGEARVIPVIVRHIDWQGVLGTLQALPKDATPISDRYWHTLDEAFFNVVKGIRKVVEELTASPPASSQEITPQEVEQRSTPSPTIPSVSPIRAANSALTTTPPRMKPEELTLLRSLEGHIGPVSSVAISADGQTVVSGSHDKTIKVWNWQTGQQLRSLEGHTGGVWSVAISPDGQTLVSGSYDSTIKVWNRRTGYLLCSLQGHTGGVYSVAMSADGQTVVSGSHDKTIKVWGKK
ncbi:MAG: WD40 repeat domain-containing protein [Chloroflexi bacterium]|nr:WD40 repeat domain-containing protein [Chloroflexota bacterium]